MVDCREGSGDGSPSPATGNSLPALAGAVASLRGRSGRRRQRSPLG